MRGKCLYCFVLLLVLGLFSGCVGNADNQTETVYVNPNAVVSPSWLSEHVKDPRIRIIEVSHAESSYKEHIPGAAFVNWRTDIADPDSDVDNMVAPKKQIEDLLSRLGINRDDTIVIYDLNGNVLAGRLFWVLRYYGHEDVRFLSRGKSGWKEEGLSLTEEVPSITPSTYTIDGMNSQYRVTVDYVQEKIGKSDVVIVDVRSPEEYSGEKAVAKRGGHIPGAVNVFWKQTLQSDGTIKSAEELRSLYETAGATPEKEIIVYCNTGVLSAYTWFVLNDLLGYPNVKLYDGSWTEWGNIADLPIVTGNNPN